MRRVSTIFGLGLTGSILFSGTAVEAIPANCGPKPLVPAFSPGHWVAKGFTAEGRIIDDGVFALDYGTASFVLDVDELGNATGTLEIHGTGVATVTDGSVGANLAITETAELSGSPTRINVLGALNVSGTATTPIGPIAIDETHPIVGEFSPQIGTCTTVGGDLLAGATEQIQGAGVNGQANAYFIATRVGDPAQVANVEGALVDLVGRIEALPPAASLNADIVHSVALQAARLNALTGAAANCGDLNPELIGSRPVATLIARAIHRSLADYLSLAQQGEYSVGDIISMLSAGVRGGVLSWDGECTTDQPAAELMQIAEQVLIERLADALAAGDDRTVIDIQSAGYDFGFATLLSSFH